MITNYPNLIKIRTSTYEPKHQNPKRYSERLMTSFSQKMLLTLLLSLLLSLQNSNAFAPMKVALIKPAPFRMAAIGDAEMGLIDVVKAVMSKETPQESSLQNLQARMRKDPDNNVMLLVILNAAAKQVMNLDLRDSEKKILKWVKKTNKDPDTIAQLSSFYQEMTPEVKKLYFPQALLSSPATRTTDIMADFGNMLTPQGWDVKNEFGWKPPVDDKPSPEPRWIDRSSSDDDRVKTSVKNPIKFVQARIDHARCIKRSDEPWRGIFDIVGDVLGVFGVDATDEVYFNTVGISDLKIAGTTKYHSPVTEDVKEGSRWSLGNPSPLIFSGPMCNGLTLTASGYEEDLGFGVISWVNDINKFLDSVAGWARELSDKADSDLEKMGIWGQHDEGGIAAASATGKIIVMCSDVAKFIVGKFSDDFIGVKVVQIPRAEVFKCIKDNTWMDMIMRGEHHDQNGIHALEVSFDEMIISPKYRIVDAKDSSLKLNLEKGTPQWTKADNSWLSAQWHFWSSSGEYRIVNEWRKEKNLQLKDNGKGGVEQVYGSTWFKESEHERFSLDANKSKEGVFRIVGKSYKSRDCKLEVV